MGLVEEGYRADMTLFDPDTVADRATYDDPAQFPAGIAYVLVGGRVAVADNRTTGERAGIPLRRQGAEAAAD